MYDPVYNTGMSDSSVVYIDDNKIQIWFPFSYQTLGLVRDIPDASFDRPNKYWWTPATPFHADKVIETLGSDRFYIGEDVYKLAQGEKKVPEFPIDKRLYDYQKAGVKFIVKTGGRAVLADAMGLGKTIIALAFVNIGRGKTLVVSPANVIWKWKAEVGKWTDMSGEVIVTSKEPLPTADVHICSYDIMKRRADELAKIPYDTVIFDECHSIKSYKAQRTKAANSIIGSGIPHAMYLSGTPFLNRPDELFTVLNMLDPLSFPTFTKFAKRYLGAFWDDYDKQWYFPNTLTNMEELRERLKTVMIRRTKQEVLPELPDKVRTIVPVDIPMAEYNAVRKELRGKVNRANALVMMTALRQVVGREKVKPAVSLVEDLLQDDEQVVIFVHHKEVAGAMRSALSEYKVGMIVGDTSPKVRQRVVDEFLNKDLDIVIISVAGAEGIDLYSASNIVFVEREWVPAKEEQAEDRLHRIGQKNSVTCYYIAARNTIDERLAKIVQTKRETFGQVVSQDEIVTEILDYLGE